MGKHLNPRTDNRSPGRFYFAGGFWYFLCRALDRPIPISGIMRECFFDAFRLREALGLSEKSFYRLVMESLDVTPTYWLRSERMVHSRALLREGGSIKQVAVAIAFSHESNFIREFKHWHGVTPGEFQNGERRR